MPIIKLKKRKKILEHGPKLIINIPKSFNTKSNNAFTNSIKLGFELKHIPKDDLPVRRKFLRVI